MNTGELNGGDAPGTGPGSGTLSPETIAAISQAVLAQLLSGVLNVNLVQVRGQQIGGSGTEAEPWGPM